MKEEETMTGGNQNNCHGNYKSLKLSVRGGAM